MYPYLLRGLTIERPNQVWCADITYIPVQGGFLYLVAIMDWAAGGCWRGGCPTRWTPSSAWRRWPRRSEQERQATGMGCEGIRGAHGSASVGSYPHIHRLVHPLPDPTPFTAA